MSANLDRRKAFAAASVALVLAATMVPTQSPNQPFSTCIWCGEQSGADAVANVILFVPLGVAFAALARRRWLVVLAAALFSTAIEITQTLFIHGRDGALSDIIFNTLGAFLGSWIIAPLASPPNSAAAARRRGIAAGAAAVGVVLLTGFLSTPVFPRTKWFGQWTPQFGGSPYYDGRVLDARIGERFVPSTALADSDAVRGNWIAGQPLVVTATASPPTADLSTVFSIADEHQRFMLVLGVDGPDIGFVLSRRATDARFVEPVVRLPDALRGVRPGDTLVLEARLADRGVCLGRIRALRCDLGLTPGSGWQFLARVDAVRRHTAMFNALWVFLLVLPAAFWLETTWMALAVALAVCAAAPAVVGLRLSPPSEWAGAVAAIAAGGVLNAFTRRRPAPLATPRQRF